MAAETETICTVTLHQPIPTGGFLDTPCKEVATHRLRHGEVKAAAYLCKRHARALRDMYEPGSIRKLRSKPAPGPARSEKP